MVGGYQIIDFHNTDFKRNTRNHWDGIYKLLMYRTMGNARKPIMISRMMIEGSVIPDMYIHFVLYQARFRAFINIDSSQRHMITVESDDSVFVTLVSN